MTKTDWIKKLTSRKLWMSLVGVLLSLGIDDAIAKAIIMLGSIVAFVLGEAWVDSKGIGVAVKTQSVNENYYENVTPPDIDPEANG